MKKILRGMVFVFVIVGIFLLGGFDAEAGPAPNLSAVQIVEVWSDGSPEKIAVSPNYPNRVEKDTPLQGTMLYIRTKFTGYPNWSTVFYRDGSSTGHPYAYTETEKKGIGNIVTGWYQTVKIPFKALSDYPTICVTASSINGGGTYSALVTGIHIQR